MIAALSCFQTAAVSAQPATETREAVLVQGSSLRAAIAAVCAVGGDVTHELGIINAVGATLTSNQLTALEAHDDSLRIRADRMTTVDSLEISATHRHGPDSQERGGPCARLETDVAETDAAR
ncbi:MAG: hypothetical protein O3A25_14740 [Acidobacteria bacterium]|nr:hypothetical protein [Acidobacteriota bacterium]